MKLEPIVISLLDTDLYKFKYPFQMLGVLRLPVIKIPCGKTFFKTISGIINTFFDVHSSTLPSHIPFLTSNHFLIIDNLSVSDYIILS